MQLATETGGTYYHANDNLQLHQVFQKLLMLFYVKLRLQVA